MSGMTEQEARQVLGHYDEMLTHHREQLEQILNTHLDGMRDALASAPGGCSKRVWCIRPHGHPKACFPYIHPSHIDESTRSHDGKGYEVHANGCEAIISDRPGTCRCLPPAQEGVREQILPLLNKMIDSMNLFERQSFAREIVVILGGETQGFFRPEPDTGKPL